MSGRCPTAIANDDDARNSKKVAAQFSTCVPTATRCLEELKATIGDWAGAPPKWTVKVIECLNRAAAGMLTELGTSASSTQVTLRDDFGSSIAPVDGHTVSDAGSRTQQRQQQQQRRRQQHQAAVHSFTLIQDDALASTLTQVLGRYNDCGGCSRQPLPNDGNELGEQAGWSRGSTGTSTAAWAACAAAATAAAAAGVAAWGWSSSGTRMAWDKSTGPSTSMNIGADDDDDDAKHTRT
jgi:hypothetical protein